MTTPALRTTASLMYGSAIYPVDDHPAMPAEFDFDNPIECAKLVLACLSNASGGHQLQRCKLAIDPVRRTANIVANGAHAFFSPGNLPKFTTIQDACAAVERTITHELGTVVTDQYGEGWKRAKWVSA